MKIDRRINISKVPEVSIPFFRDEKYRISFNLTGMQRVLFPSPVIDATLDFVRENIAAIEQRDDFLVFITQIPGEKVLNQKLGRELLHAEHVVIDHKNEFVFNGILTGPNVATFSNGRLEQGTYCLSICFLPNPDCYHRSDDKPIELHAGEGPWLSSGGGCPCQCTYL